MTLGKLWTVAGSISAKNDSAVQWSQGRLFLFFMSMKDKETEEIRIELLLGLGLGVQEDIPGVKNAKIVIQTYME